MCNVIKGFKLCTCEPEKLKEATLTWELERYVSVNKSGIMGKIAAPAQDFLSMSKELIENELNMKQCFDFDYQPQEKDALYLNNKGTGYCSFVYTNGKWKSDFPHPFKTIYKTISKGVVEVENVDEEETETSVPLLQALNIQVGDKIRYRSDTELVLVTSIEHETHGVKNNPEDYCFVNNKEYWDYESIVEIVKTE